MKRPRVQTKKKMSSSVSETCDPPIPPPSFPPRVVCERALTLLKAVIIKSPARKPHPPSEQPNSFVTRKYCENRDEVEESGENRERGGRLSFSKLSLEGKRHLSSVKIHLRAEAPCIRSSPTAVHLQVATHHGEMRMVGGRWGSLKLLRQELATRIGCLSSWRKGYRKSF